MNKEQTAIAKTVVQWTELARTGESKFTLVLESCYLCQYAYEVTKTKFYTAGGRCKACSYFKKYGMCNKYLSPFWKWLDATTKADKRLCAAEFCEQVKTLQEKDMNKQEELENRLAQALVSERVLHAQVVESLEHQLVQLAEAEKPKLRHGDWWWKGEKRLEARIFLKEIKDEKRDCVALPDCLLTTIGSTYEGQPIEGNIFTDLKALGKPLESFETDAHKYYIKRLGFTRVCIFMAGNWHTIEEVEEHSLKLRRLTATYKAGK